MHARRSALLVLSLVLLGAAGRGSAEAIGGEPTPAQATTARLLTASAPSFDGDGRPDPAVIEVDPAGGSRASWLILPSKGVCPPGLGTPVRGEPAGGAAPQCRLPFGRAGDLPVAADYDGDGVLDVATWRPSDAEWSVLASSGACPAHLKRAATHENGRPICTLEWGEPDGAPVAADFDGDGLADTAVWQPGAAEWRVRLSQPTARPVSRRLGAPGDHPVPADYDGDGRPDLAVFQRGGAEPGTWLVAPSTRRCPVSMRESVGSPPGEPVCRLRFGLADDTPLPADHDADGLADLAVFRADGPGASAVWYVSPSSGTCPAHLADREGRSLGAKVCIREWGLFGDVPVVSDLDGDGTPDLGLWRSAFPIQLDATWLVAPSSGTCPGGVGNGDADGGGLRVCERIFGSAAELVLPR
jgi:hypothetical protein